VYCVTASVKWAVEPGAQALGIAADCVIGIRTKVVNGLVTDELDGPITWREGKVVGLLEATGRKMPFLAGGNTMGDLALLDSASHIQIANIAAAKGDFNYETEMKLLDLAKRRCWFFHEYRP
jgi:phosphoserine phosphatase